MNPAIARIRKAPIQIISFSHLSKGDAHTIEVLESEDNPSTIFDKKVEALAEILGCSEAQATRIILNKL